jgi:hypothetical protein
MPQANGIVRIIPGKNDRDEDVFSVIVKRSYRLAHGAPARRCEVDGELREVDHYYDGGDPEWSTVQHEHEVAAYKRSIDVVVVGKAYAPRGVPTAHMTASVRVGAKEKSVVVVGDRECRHRPGGAPIFTDPVPFTEMEIRFDRAYGGRDETSVPEIPFFYPRNDMGKGVALRNARDVVDGLALPNIEDPEDLLTPDRIVIGEPDRWHLQPLPQGFGWLQRVWYPRCAWMGVFPAFLDVGTVTAEERLGLVPRNHVALAKQFRLPTSEARFNNGASHGLIFPTLSGTESIALRGLSPDGVLDFSLPGDPPRISLDIGLGERELEARLHTVSIRPDDLEMDLVWRGACAYEGYGWLPRMTRLHAEVQ